MNAHQHFAGRRLWCSYFLELQDVRTAEFMNPNRFHFFCLQVPKRNDSEWQICAALELISSRPHAANRLLEYCVPERAVVCSITIHEH